MDGIEPFRTEYERWCNVYRTMLFKQMGKKRWVINQADWFASKEQMNRAYKVLKIAQCKGPAAAIMWKLAN